MNKLVNFNPCLFLSPYVDSMKIQNNLVANSVNNVKYMVGGSNAPYQTIQSAINAAALSGNQETVVISSGIYNENITLANKVSLMGISPLQVLDGSVTITGKITASFSNGETGITNLNIKPVGSSCLDITGSSMFLTINNVSFVPDNLNNAIYANNPSATVILDNCVFSSGLNFYYIDNIGTMLTKNSTVGLFFPSQITVNGGNFIFFNSVVGGKIYVNTGTAQCNIVNSVIVGGMGPSITVNNSMVILMHSFIVADDNGDFIVGTGLLISGLDALLGRTTIAAGITHIPVTTI